MSDKKSKSIDLGQLQTEFQTAEKEYRTNEKALVRAQELRDASKIKYNTADAALRNATRTILG